MFWNRLICFHGSGAAAQQARQTESGEACKTGLEHSAPAEQHEPFSLQRLQMLECVTVAMAVTRSIMHETSPACG
jgi:hypothetical protein